MRWDALFADLEAQLDAEQTLQLGAEVAERTRVEWAGLTVIDRLRAQVGQPLTWSTTAGERVEGRLMEVGSDWVLLGVGRVEVLVPMAAVASVSGLGPAAEQPGPAPLARRLPLSVVLRGLARDRSVVTAQLVGGERLIGTVDRVGADHLDLSLHPRDEPRRPSGLLDRRTVPMRALQQLSL